MPASQVSLHPVNSLQGTQPPAKGIRHLRGDRAGLGSSQDQAISYRNSALQDMQIYSDSKFTSSKKRSSQPDRGKKVCQHLHSRNRVGGGAFCSSGAGRFYCFVQCLCTRNSPHTQTHRFRVPTVLLRVQYLPRDTLSPHKKKSRQENILKDKIKLSQSGTLLIPSQAAFWMRSSFMDGLTSVPDKSPVA